MDDPIRVVENLYEQTGSVLSDCAKENMRYFLQQQSEKRKKTRAKMKRYTLEDFGLDVNCVNSAFAAYREYFDKEKL